MLSVVLLLHPFLFTSCHCCWAVVQVVQQLHFVYPAALPKLIRLILTELSTTNFI